MCCVYSSGALPAGSRKGTEMGVLGHARIPSTQGMRTYKPVRFMWGGTTSFPRVEKGRSTRGPAGSTVLQHAHSSTVVQYILVTAIHAKSYLGRVAPFLFSLGRWVPDGRRNVLYLVVNVNCAGRGLFCRGCIPWADFYKTYGCLWDSFSV